MMVHSKDDNGEQMVSSERGGDIDSEGSVGGSLRSEGGGEGDGACV